MSTYFNILDTDEGQVGIITNSKALGLFSFPRTSVAPQNRDNLKAGTVIKWKTSDSTLLERLHHSTVLAVQKTGLSGLASLAELAMRTEELMKVTHRTGSAVEEIAVAYQERGLEFPFPPEVVPLIKGFM